MMLSNPRTRTIRERDLELALILSSKLGHIECAECLIEAGVSPEVKDTNGNSPLFLAVESNNDDIARLLLQSKGNANSRGRGKSTALHMAAKLGHDNCVTQLINHGANVNLRDSGGNTPLILASKYGNYTAMKLLIDVKCNLDLQDNEGFTALHYASHKARGANLLLNAGANPDITDGDNITPLIMAASEGFDEVVKSLVRAKCNVNIANSSVHKTALHILAGKGHWDCISDIIFGGADVNLYDDFMHTPLYYAVNNGHYEVVKLLLRANCMVDTFQCSASVPHEACPARLALSKGLLNIVKLFILTGYDRHHLQMGLAEEELRIKIGHSEDIEHWLEHAQGVMTLKQVCRKWIRHHLGSSFYHDLELLPIPKVMKEFVFMKELDDEHWTLPYTIWIVFLIKSNKILCLLFIHCIKLCSMLNCDRYEVW